MDANHLVMVGEEGFYANANPYDWKLNGSKGQDFLRDHGLPAVDVASFHLWPSPGKYNMDAVQTIEWIDRHLADAKKLGKPAIIDEFGEFRGFNKDTVERDRFYKLIFDAFNTKDISGLNFWQLLSSGYAKYDDGYGIFYPEDSSTIALIKAAATVNSK
jgi:mannan endo-1,4-beta-mannosidase